MAYSEEIRENIRSGAGGGLGHEDERNSGSNHNDTTEDSRVAGTTREQQAEDYKSQFYEIYLKVAEEHDKEFVEKHSEDLSTALIFAGLFSAVTSAFIIQIDSRLQPNPNSETAALLRFLIHKIDNSTFGHNIPALPQWTGPPRTMVHVQALLFASLSTSLLSALLAILGKQWLNRYASTGKRGSSVERSQNRQRKLDGVVTWYFDSVMGSPPIMLQIALLLLGCALSRYLWEIDVTIACIALGVTSFGALSYLFIVVTGTISDTCPYQNPGSHALRHLRPKVWKLARSASSAIASLPSDSISAFRIARESGVANKIRVNMTLYRCLWRKGRIKFIWKVLCCAPYGLSVGGRHPLRDISRTSTALPTRAYDLVRGVYNRLFEVHPVSARGSDKQAITLDLQCISWTLQTSLDRAIRLSTLSHLMTIPELTNFNPSLATDCFDILSACVSIRNSRAVIMRGLDQLAAVSAGCFYRTFHHLSAIDATLCGLTDLRRRYDRAFPFETDFTGLPFYHTMIKIHALANQHWSPRDIRWDDYRAPSQEYTRFARHMVGAAHAEYQQSHYKKVPRWILRFALHSLSLNPLPPASVVADCVAIIAIDLDCGAPNFVTPNESEQMEWPSSFITQKLRIIVETANPDQIYFRRKPIVAMFPLAISLKREGQQEMFETIVRAARASNSWGFMWRRIGPHVITLFSTPRHPSIDWGITLMSPNVRWDDGSHNKNTVARWAAAAFAVPYTEEIGRCVVDATLQIASFYLLRPHIPTEMWTFLGNQPSLPPICRGRVRGSALDVIRHVRGLEDFEICKAHLLLVWSEWDPLSYSGLDEMKTLIRDDFGGIGMWRHREDLVKRLDHVLGQLERGLEWLKGYKPNLCEFEIHRAKRQYGELKDVLLEVDNEAKEVLARSRSTFTCALPLPYP